MTATAAQIARLRRMTAEPTDAVYDDDAISEYIERYPLLDERGEIPYTWDQSTDPPTQDTNEQWIETYDLMAAAADIWDEKAALLSTQYNFAADGGRYDRSQAFEHAQGRARYYRSRRAAATMRGFKYPEENQRATSTPWIANAAEPDNDF